MLITVFFFCSLSFSLSSPQDLGALTVWVMRDYNSVEPIILSVPEKDEVRCELFLLVVAGIQDFHTKTSLSSSFLYFCCLAVLMVVKSFYLCLIPMYINLLLLQ